MPACVTPKLNYRQLAAIRRSACYFIPRKYIYDIPGYPKIKAGDLVQNLEKQLTTFNHQYCLEETVLSVEKQEDYIEVTTDKGIHYSKAVILALETAPSSRAN